jgi:hypothetical protein
MRNDGLFTYARDNFQNFFYIINKKNYLFRATLFNADNIAVDLQKSAIKELYLHDNIYNPFINGYLTVDNTDDVIERFKTDPKNKEFDEVRQERGYRTRGDGRDLLFLSIIPVELPNNPYDEQSIEYNRVFGFQYIFVLGNESDIITETGKLKKYDIVDIDFEVLKEKKIFFSTIDLLKNRQNVAFLSDSQRSGLTGESMKYIIKNGLQDNSAIFTTLSGAAEITPNFESGVSRLFYSSPNNYTALDDLMYMYNLHVSNSVAKDFSFLKKEPYSGEYTLISASNHFNKAFNKSSDSGGKFYIENLNITGTQDASNIIENDIKKPLRGALQFGEQSDIIEVKFFNTPGTTYQENVKTILVHSYHFENKTFDINEVDGDIENIKKDFSNFYVDPMKGKDNRPYPNLIINNTQKNNLNFDNKFLIYESDKDFLKLAVGRNEILKNALKLNIGVELIVQGGFQRQAGRFISIDRTGNYIDNDFDNKFLGLYFIVSVEHIFVNDDTYNNKIIAIKTYHYTDPKINENIP